MAEGDTEAGTRRSPGSQGWPPEQGKPPELEGEPAGWGGRRVPGTGLGQRRAPSGKAPGRVAPGSLCSLAGSSRPFEGSGRPRRSRRAGYKPRLLRHRILPEGEGTQTAVPLPTICPEVCHPATTGTHSVALRGESVSVGQQLPVPTQTLPLTSWGSRWRAREKKSTAISQSSCSKH